MPHYHINLTVTQMELVMRFVLMLRFMHRIEGKGMTKKS